MNIKLLIFVALLVVTSLEIHPFKSLKTLSQKDLSEDDLVQIIETSSTEPLEKLSHDYYVLTVVSRNKRQAYSRLTRLLRKGIQILIRYKIIPDQNHLAKTKVKQHFINYHRKWSFEILFSVYGKQSELEMTWNQLKKIGIKKLNIKASIKFLEQKMQVLKIFNSAKHRVEQALKNFKNYEIKQVIGIQIQGSQLNNSDQLESQLQQEFNDNLNEGLQDVDQTDIDQNRLWMKIVFRVGTKQEEESEEYEKYEQSEQQSNEQSQQDTQHNV